MLDILQTREIDIYITIFGAILGFLLSYFFSPSSNSGTTNINQTVTINNIKRKAKKTVTASQVKNENTVILLFLVVGLLVYFFFRTTILNTLLYSGLMLFSMWVGATFRMYISGVFIGLSWSIYLLFVILFIFTYFIVILMAFTPVYSPINFHHAEAIINAEGLKGINNAFNGKDFPWAISHFLGIFFLLYAFWFMCMSLLHMLLSGASMLGSTPNKQTWLVRKTAKYCDRPWGNIFILTLLILLAGILVSGVAYNWLQNDLPQHIETLTNIIINGRR